MSTSVKHSDVGCGRHVDFATTAEEDNAHRTVEVLLTGVGGQGIQLLSRTLALAAVAEGRRAMMLGNYGGTIRGGMTEGTVVVSDGVLRSLPIIPSAWAGFVMSPLFWDSTRARLRPGGPVVANSSLLPSGWVEELRSEGFQVFPVPADEIAKDLGAPLSAGFVLLAAFSAITGLVVSDSLIDAMKRQTPSYRRANVASNEDAIVAGFGVAPPLAAPAFQ